MKVHGPERKYLHVKIIYTLISWMICHSWLLSNITIKPQKQILHNIIVNVRLSYFINNHFEIQEHILITKVNRKAERFDFIHSVNCKPERVLFMIKNKSIGDVNVSMAPINTWANCNSPCNFLTFRLTHSVTYIQEACAAYQFIARKWCAMSCKHFITVCSLLCN